MRRSVILLALALVAVVPSAHATLAPCINCGLYGTEAVYVDGQRCPVCVRPSNYNCPGITGAAVCCGGDTYIPCPTIACSTSTSVAISGTGGCALATSKMTSLARSQTAMDFEFPDTVYKTLLDSFCLAQDVTDTAIEEYATKLSVAYAKAFAKAVATWSGWVCTCVTCPRCPTTATTVLTANIAAYAQAQAAAVASAIAETTTCGDGWPVAAGADAQAFAMDTQTALLNVVRSATAYNGGCGKYFYSYDFELATAKALACAWVKALVKARYTLNSNTWEYTAVSCSNTLASTGMLTGLGCKVDYCLEPKNV